MLTTKKQYDIVNWILWGLKFPEIGLTIGTIVGFVACIFGIINVYIPVSMLIVRIILFPIRLFIISKKRKLERSAPSLVPKKKDYIFKYG
ncbi:MAG: hypothetical protein WCX79_01065 [Candidatus Paceibacterota bacterium]|jgi:hypothetical protein